MKRNEIFAYLAIITVPIAYGSFYSIFKYATTQFSIFWLCWIRMVIALISLIPLIINKLKITKEGIIGAALTGFVFFIGLIAQSYSLLFISAGTAGFIAVSFVILTPLFNLIFFKKKIPKYLLIPISIIILGYFMMFFSFNGQKLTFGFPELLNFIGAIVIAFQIILFDKYRVENEVIAFTFLQFIWVFLYITVFNFSIREPFLVIPKNPLGWGLILYLGIITTTLPFLTQFWGQKYVLPSVTAIIISFEPILATIFGFWILNEKITIQFLISGFLILLAVFGTIFIQYQFELPLPKGRGFVG